MNTYDIFNIVYSIAIALFSVYAISIIRTNKKEYDEYKKQRKN